MQSQHSPSITDHMHAPHTHHHMPSYSHQNNYPSRLAQSSVYMNSSQMLEQRGATTDLAHVGAPPVAGSRSNHHQPHQDASHFSQQNLVHDGFGLSQAQPGFHGVHGFKNI